MPIEIEADQLDDYFSEVKDEIKKRIKRNLPNEANEILQESEEKIFNKEVDSSGQKWKKLSMVGLLSREDNVNETYTSIDDVQRSAERTDTLNDTGRLRRSLTQQGQGGISDTTLKSNKIKFEYGTNVEGAKESQEGGSASGLTTSEFNRAVDRLRGTAKKLVPALRQFVNSGGDVPQREFLYFTPESIKKLTISTLKQIEVSVQKVGQDFQ